MMKSKTNAAMAAADFILDQYAGDTLSKAAEARIKAVAEAIKRGGKK